MKIFSIILLAVFIVSQSEALDLNGKLKEVLESLKETLKTGDESKGIPPLDPFELKDIPGPFNISFMDDLTGTIDAKSLGIANISDYNVKNAAFSIVGLKVNVSLEWPVINGNLSEYDINCRLMNFVNVFGTGLANFIIKDFKFSIETSMSSDKETKKLGLKSLSIAFSFGDMEIDIDGLYGDQMMSEVISHVISDLAPEIFDKYYPILKPVAEQFIWDEANKILGKMTMKDLLEIINGGKRVKAFLL